MFWSVWSRGPINCPRNVAVCGKLLKTHLALVLGELELARGGGARAVSGSDGRDTVGGSTVDVGQVGEVRLGVADGDVDDAVVDEPGDGGQVSGFLATVLGRGRGEGRGELAGEGARGPELASGVEEGRDLGGETTETGGGTEEEAVKLLELLGLGEGVDDGVLGLERATSVHLLEDLGGEGLLNLVGLGDGASGLDTLDDLLSEGAALLADIQIAVAGSLSSRGSTSYSRNVAVGAVEDDTDNGLADGSGSGRPAC